MAIAVRSADGEEADDGVEGGWEDEPLEYAAREVLPLTLEHASAHERLLHTRTRTRVRGHNASEVKVTAGFNFHIGGAVSYMHVAH